MMRSVLLALLISVGCQKSDEQKRPAEVAASAGTPKQRSGIPQVAPPLDLKNPPADAVRTESGLVYKKLVENESGQRPKRNDTVMIRYTGWRQDSGETFFSNRSQDNPMPLNLATTARGFTEAMQLVRKGEKAMLWLPPAIGLKEPPQGVKPETLVYEVEVVDIREAPEVPPDVAAPPASALVAKRTGVRYVVIKAGTGTDKPRNVDEVTFHHTSWDADGRMLETTEIKKVPAKSAPFRQLAPLEEILTGMTAGQRVRFWADAAAMKPSAAGPKGQLAYEVELLQIDKAAGTPPPTPPDVAQPPAGAKKTDKGVFYRMLKAGKGGPKPKPTDAVKVHYTGWTVDGRMFDSSYIRNEPSEFSLQGVIAGWTDGIPLMSVGDRYRFWIPDTLAYKGQPERPQGMLVFDVELLEIKAPAHPDMHGHP